MTITIKHYIEAAKAKGWKVEWIDDERNIIAIYPPGEDPIIIRNNVTELATAIGSVISSLKSASTTLAKQVGFQVPETMVVEEDESFKKAKPILEKYGKIVVKPMDGAHGNGVSTNVSTLDQLSQAIEEARKHNIKSGAIVAQQFCTGRDYRLFMLDGKVAAAIERVPFSVLGDGVSTVEKLVTDKLEHMKKKKDNKVKAIDVDREALLQNIDQRRDDILPSGELLVLQGVANLSKGGESIDVTDTVNPLVELYAANLMKLLKMDMCAVDVLSADISADPNTAQTMFIEINVAPGFRGHYYPTVGKKRELAPLILDTIIKKRHQK